MKRTEFILACVSFLKFDQSIAPQKVFVNGFFEFFIALKRLCDNSTKDSALLSGKMCKFAVACINGRS